MLLVRVPQVYGKAFVFTAAQSDRLVKFQYYILFLPRVVARGYEPFFTVAARAGIGAHIIGQKHTAAKQRGVSLLHSVYAGKQRKFIVAHEPRVSVKLRRKYQRAVERLIYKLVFKIIYA